VNAAQHPLQPLIRALRVRSSLDDDALQALQALPYKVRHLESSTYILREGDFPESCAILLDGFAYRQKLTGEGARQILALHIAGEPLDFQHLFLNVADHSIQMLTYGAVAMIPRKAMQGLVLCNPAIAGAVVTSVLVDSSISREWVLNVGRRDARSRIAHLLCEFGIRMKSLGLAGPDACELPITQEQLADATGLTTVHVNRTLKALEAAGLIARSKRTIAFPDWERLRDAGDFNSRYLHLDVQQNVG
jgi:CRP-like cAMP-binding protein